MTSDSAVARRLDDTASRQPPPPDTLPHPGDAFPLQTLSNPPSASSISDLTSDDDENTAPRRTALRPTRPPGNVAKLIHPPTPTGPPIGGMEQSTRRRSSSITGTAAVSASKQDRKHRSKRRRDDHIAEEGEEDSAGHASDSGSRSDSTDFELDDMSADGLDDDEETGLTKKVRRKNAKRKRRNTLLDNRVVPDTGLTFTKEEKAAADQSLYRSMLINVTLICLW
jgi:solute carrier family 35 protein C2